MLAECINCGFYVASNEKFCPDCGLSVPNAPLMFSSDESDRPLTVKNVVIITIVIVIGIFLFRHFQDSYDFSDSFGLIALILIISLVLFVFIVPVITHYSTKRERRQRYASAENPTNFRFIQDTILLKNHELKEKLREFGSTGKRGKRISRDVNELNTTPEKIEIQNMIARYDLLNNKIDFARLQNQLLPIVEQRNALKFKEDFSEQLDGILSEIELTILSLTDEYAAKISEQFESEKQEFLAQVIETEKLCQALLGRQSDVQPIQYSFETLPSNDLTRQINNFDVRATLRNFTESFLESEREYQRWKTSQR